jgi:FkbM family methyltransferase
MKVFFYNILRKTIIGKNRRLKIHSDYAGDVYFLGNYLEDRLFLGNNYEKEIIELIVDKITHKNYIIYDIGAHRGYFTLLFSKIIGGKGVVYSFEPNHLALKLLRENILLNKMKNVIIKPYAIGNESKKIELMIPKGRTERSTLNSDLRIFYRKHFEVSAIDVDARAIDELIMAGEIKPANFVKIDVEGYEQKVLIGMKKLIKNSMPDLLIELHGAGIEKKVSNIKKILNFIFSFEYNCFHLEKKRQIKKTDSYEEFCKGHVFATKNKSFMKQINTGDKK